jgi:hypothetical protein
MGYKNNRNKKGVFSMFLIRFGRWTYAGGRWFSWERFLIKGYIWTPFVKVEKRFSHRKRIASLRSLLEVSGSDGNWNDNPYLFGMHNGMELSLSILENREVQYKNAPDVFLGDVQGPREANVLGEDKPTTAE